LPNIAGVKTIYPSLLLLLLLLLVLIFVILLLFPLPFFLLLPYMNCTKGFHCDLSVMYFGHSPPTLLLSYSPKYKKNLKKVNTKRTKNQLINGKLIEQTILLPCYSLSPAPTSVPHLPLPDL
jgi:hypothetical protein